MYNFDKVEYVSAAIRCASYRIDNMAFFSRRKGLNPYHDGHGQSF